MPDYNVEYSIFLESSRESVKREISKVASRIVSDKGVPQYDFVKAYNSDRFIVDGFIGDSVRQVVARFPDVCKAEMMTVTNEEEGHNLLFYLPDIDPDFADAGGDELERFITNNTTALWLATRSEVFAKFYTEQASASMERLVTILRTRKPVTR